MIQKHKNFQAGYFYILFCCLANAVSFVFISHLNKTHNEMLSIFMTFLYATLLFNLVNFKKLKHIYTTVLCNKKTLFMMNMLTLVNWLSTFMSLRYLDPATALCLNLGLLSVTVFLISTPIKKLRANKHLGLSVVFVLMSLGLIVKQYLAVNPGEANFENFLLGLVWCLCGGISGAFIGFSSEAMGRCGLSITQILSTRFYLLILISGISLLFLSPEEFQIDWNYYLFSSLIIVILPLLMYQAAIRDLGVMLVALIEPFSPVLTYILQVSIGLYFFNVLTIIFLGISSLAIAWFVRIEQKIQEEKYKFSS